MISFLLDKSVVSVVIYRGVVFFFFSSFSPSSYCDHSKPCSCPVPTSRYQPFYHRCLDLCTIDLTAAPAAECHPPFPLPRAPCVRVRVRIPPSHPHSLVHPHRPRPAHPATSSVFSPPAPPFLLGSGLDSLEEETDSLTGRESVACQGGHECPCVCLQACA